MLIKEDVVVVEKQRCEEMKHKHETEDELSVLKEEKKYDPV